MTIPETITAKIDEKMGKQYTDILIELTNRGNNDYNRGVIHGFLITLMMGEAITGSEAIVILDLFREAHEK